MDSLRARSKRFLEVMLLSLLGALPVAAFFISALFPGYTPFTTTETGTILILTPLVIGTLFGFLLSEQDIRSVAAGSLVITLLSAVFIILFILSPIVAGVASAAPAVTPGEVIEIYIAQRVMLFVVISFPVLLLGSIVGRALSERMVPSEELRIELERLKAETREWHRVLEDKMRKQGGIADEKDSTRRSVEPSKEEDE